MRVSSWIIVASWLNGLGTSLAVPDTHVVHERRDANWGSGLKKRSKPDQGLQLPMRIGLKQSNLDKGPQWLMDVSHPKSENYGKHWTSEEIIDAFRPADDTVEAVKQWLKDNGISEERITHTDNKVWLAFEASLEEAENLLHTEYFVHENKKGRLITDVDNYAVPKHLAEHIDYITPGVKGTDITPRLQRSEDMAAREVRTGRNRLRPFKELEEATVSLIEADAAAACATAITPLCLQALYQFDALNSSSPVSSNNSMGIFEEGDYFAQADLNSFYTKYASYIPTGWAPKVNGIDGGSAPVAVAKAGGESNLDFELAIPIIYPQTTIDYQTDDAYYAAGGGGATGIFNTFFDALDGSYCTYCAEAECGNDPTLDPTYPDSHTGGYKGELQCGVYEPTNVISISYGEQESDLPASYQIRQCNEFLKLGLQGVSIFVASGDTGVGDGSTACLKGKSSRVFSPTQPNSCPWLTNVGSTYVPTGNTVNDPEVATTSFGSGGGFSNIFPIPDYQTTAVQTYYDTAEPTYAYYTNGSYTTSAGVYNRDGRGIPDVAANGDNIAVYLRGRIGSEGGTSASSPIFAALVTRINEERLAAGKTPVGFINPTLYENPDVLNDIVTGTNPGCGTKGFSCSKGWDPVTGLGTPNYPKMLKLFLSLP